MRRYIKIYLNVLPVFSLVGIILSVFRTAYQDNYAQVFLGISAVFDLGIIVAGRKYWNRKFIVWVLVFMLMSLTMGLLNNNELSRRYITDFTNPFFFFAKTLVFIAYWNIADFEKYTKYYIKVSFWGSLALLPVTYFLFNQAGATRLAIFPLWSYHFPAICKAEVSFSWPRY